ncbi:probable cytochrome P450 6a14 isoform X2 [Homalodisca vitripennis]|nr:probable cytochrome P450 6a14 isoform X2 [Homalodisca vitripennis]
MLIELATAVAAIVGAMYLYLSRNNDYWKKKNVVYIKPSSTYKLILSQILGKVDTSTVMQQWYTEYKEQNLRYVGSISVSERNLILIDLDLCKNVLTKDFQHFMARDLSPTTHEYISKHLFSLEGQEWKDMRIKLTPTFTSGKMKNMFLLMRRCADQLRDHIDKVVLQKGEFEVKDLIARFTTDIIATCAFGLEVNSIENRETEFYKVGLRMFAPKLIMILKLLMHRCLPGIAKFLKLNITDPSDTDFLSRIVKDTVEYRMKNNVVRNDFVDLLMQVKDKNPQEPYDNTDNTEITGRSNLGAVNQEHHGAKEQLTLEQMTAQAFVFILAGFETAASTTSFCLYELAKSPTVQERLRQEIDEVLANYDNKITYQALQDMTYMDQVINETLRRYASLPFLTRVCTDSYQFPDTDLIIDKGVRIIIPTYAIHHDPDIYPDPYKFDPDRFSEVNFKGRHQYAFLPFGEGPRNCIGMRFGRLQVKMGLVAILSKYRLSPAPDTPSRLQLNPFSVFTTPKQPFSLKIINRDECLP